MNTSRFIYASLVSTDHVSAAATLDAIGLTKSWEGVHPHLGTPGSLFATKAGGVLVLEAPTVPSAVFSRVLARSERWFHLALTGSVEHREALTGRAGLEVSEIYEGPLGPAYFVNFDEALIPMEFTVDTCACAASESSGFTRVESTGMTAPAREPLEEAFAKVGIRTDPRLDSRFPTLSGNDNRIAILGRHYLEITTANAASGGLTALAKRMNGEVGIFGLNLEPDSMSEFLARAAAAGVRLNSEAPVRLNCEVGGTEMACANIITIHPSSTGGGRMFVLEPLEYPWDLLAELDRGA